MNNSVKKTLWVLIDNTISEHTYIKLNYDYHKIYDEMIKMVTIRNNDFKKLDLTENMLYEHTDRIFCSINGKLYIELKRFKEESNNFSEIHW